MEKKIIVQLSLQESKSFDFLAASKSIVEASNAEVGCLSYKLLKDVDQSNEFIIYEAYEDEKALNAHNNSEHLKNFLNLVTPWLAKAPIFETF